MEKKDNILIIGLCFIGITLSCILMQHVAIARSRYWIFGISNFLFYLVFLSYFIKQLIQVKGSSKKIWLFVFAAGMILFYIGLYFPFLIILRQAVF